MPNYCVVVKDPADTRYDRVRSKHRTKRLAQKAARGKRHASRVVACPASAKRGARFERSARLMKRRRLVQVGVDRYL